MAWRSIIWAREREHVSMEKLFIRRAVLFLFRIVWSRFVPVGCQNTNCRTTETKTCNEKQVFKE